jgi:hypothetical protein
MKLPHFGATLVFRLVEVLACEYPLLAEQGSEKIFPWQVNFTTKPACDRITNVIKI